MRTEQKPIGVFVRLPLSEDQLNEFHHTVMYCEEEDALRSIGTPVTGGELEVVCSIDEDILRDIRELGDDDEEYVTDMVFKPDPEGVDTIPLVRQSDALAKLAEKDAEILRLREIVGVFSAKIAEHASEGWDIPAPECVDLLDEAGVIEWGTFDPEVHDRAMFDGCESGDPIWTLKGPEA